MQSLKNAHFVFSKVSGLSLGNHVFENIFWICSSPAVRKYCLVTGRRKQFRKINEEDGDFIVVWISVSFCGDLARGGAGQSLCRSKGRRRVCSRPRLTGKDWEGHGGRKPVSNMWGSRVPEPWRQGVTPPLLCHMGTRALLRPPAKQGYQDPLTHWNSMI